MPARSSKIFWHNQAPESSSSIFAVKGGRRVIEIDAKGNFAMLFNSEGCTAAGSGRTASRHVAIYRH